MDTLYLCPECRTEEYIQTCDGSYFCDCGHTFTEDEIVIETAEYIGT